MISTTRDYIASFGETRKTCRCVVLTRAHETPELVKKLPVRVGYGFNGFMRKCGKPGQTDKMLESHSHHFLGVTSYRHKIYVILLDNLIQDGCICDVHHTLNSVVI